MKITSVWTAVAVTIGLAAPASALTITSVSGLWESANVSYGSAVDLGTNHVSWGRAPNGQDQSSYLFEGEATPFETEVDEMFTLGTFTHFNNPIYIDGSGALLNSANLNVSFSIEGSNEVYSSVFTFTHWETPNDATPCADNGTNGVGVNVNGCADRVSVSLNEAASESFTVNGMEYLLDITGFLYQSDVLDSFWTQERAENEAELQASYRLVSEVPLPASGLLLLGGLAGLAVARRRK